jgi:hypothetical protein
MNKPHFHRRSQSRFGRQYENLLWNKVNDMCPIENNGISPSGVEGTFNELAS